VRDRQRSPEHRPTVTVSGLERTADRSARALAVDPELPRERRRGAVIIFQAGSHRQCAPARFERTAPFACDRRIDKPRSIGQLACGQTNQGAGHKKGSIHERHGLPKQVRYREAPADPLSRAPIQAAAGYRMEGRPTKSVTTDEHTSKAATDQGGPVSEILPIARLTRPRRLRTVRCEAGTDRSGSVGSSAARERPFRSRRNPRPVESACCQHRETERPDVTYMDHAVIGVKGPAPGPAPVARARTDRNTGPR
jgi:hypothetical protein